MEGQALTAGAVAATCMVCGGISSDEESLTCTACRDFAADRRLHPGFDAPSGWGKTVQHYVSTISWLDAAAQRYGIPPPAALTDATGPWAHFVLAVHAYNSGKHAHAAAEAGFVAAGPDVPGFPGMKDTARQLRDAAHQGLAAKGVVPVRRFKAVVRVNLPDLPVDADFSKSEWQHYQAAIEHLRRHDVKAAHRAVSQGLKVHGFDNDDVPVTWYLKRLGAAISAAKQPRAAYDLRHVPALPEDVAEMLDHYGVARSPEADLSHPAWGLVARVHAALDNRSWVSAYRWIEEARRLAMPDKERPAVAQAMQDAEARIPVKRNVRKIGLPDAPNVRPARRVYIRDDKGRARWR